MPRTARLTRSFVQATAALLLAACGLPSPAAPVAQPPSAAAPPVSTSPPAAAEKQVVLAVGKDDGAFNILLFPRSICACNSLIYGTLFQLNDDGTGVQGDLVDHWDTQPDGLGYTLYLRQNAVWHDGQPVTADDVVFSFDALRDPKNATTTGANLDGIESYAAVGPSAVQLKLKSPTPALLNRLTRVGVVPKHLLADESNIPASPFNQHPIGSGPFKFDSYTPGVQLTLTRNDAYYRGQPGVDRVIVRFLPDPNAATIQLKSGEVDLARINSSNVPALQDASNVVVDQFPTNGEGIVNINLRRPILADLAVRQALSYATDREAIGKGVFSGLGQMEQGPIASSSAFFAPGVDALYAYDLPKAESLLAQEGWQKGSDGVLTKDGAPLELTMNVNSESDTHVKLGQAIQSEWKLLGVKVDLRVIDFATWRDLNFTKKDFDVFYNAYGSALDPDDTEFAKYYSDSPGNLVGLADPQIDRDLEQGRVAVDVAQRKQLYADYQQRMTQLLPVLFVGYDKVLIAANKRLHGLTVRPVGYDGNAYFDNAYLWTVD
jgi:peptide/nickel transport system substrate-binding protein